MLTLPSHYGKSVVFPCVRLRVAALATTRAIRIFNVELLYSRNRLFDSVRRISNGKPFFPASHQGMLYRLRSGSDHSALLTQAWQGAEEIAAPKGAEAPTPDGRSSRVERDSESPNARCRAAGRRGGDDLRNRVARQEGLPQRGAGGRRGQGAAQAPVPCPPPGGDQARMPGNSRKPAREKRKQTTKPDCRAASAIPRKKRKKEKKDSPLTWRLSLVSDDVQASCRKGARFPFGGTVRIVNRGGGGMGSWYYHCKVFCSLIIYNLRRACV